MSAEIVKARSEEQAFAIVGEKYRGICREDVVIEFVGDRLVKPVISFQVFVVNVIGAVVLLGVCFVFSFVTVPGVGVGLGGRFVINVCLMVVSVVVVKVFCSVFD